MAALFLAVFFFIWMLCDLFNLRFFQNQRAKAMKDGKRKKFRRAEALVQLAVVIFLLAIYCVERIAGIEMTMAQALCWFGIPGLLVILLALYVEIFYYKKMQN